MAAEEIKCPVTGSDTGGSRSGLPGSKAERVGCPKEWPAGCFLGNWTRGPKRAERVLASKLSAHGCRTGNGAAEFWAAQAKDMEREDWGRQTVLMGRLPGRANERRRHWMKRVAFRLGAVSC